ncbi:MAG: hypothetical protein ABI723_25645 [Bacteroidia bacterium]
MEKTGVFPSMESGEINFNNRLLLISSAYRAIYGILGGFITALTAQGKFMKAVIILGCIGTAISLTGLIVMWGKSTLWYPLSLVILSLPYTIIGGKIYEKYLLKK